MNVEDLIKELHKIKDKTLPIRCVLPGIDEENLFIINVECSETGSSGYTTSGEVRLIVSE